MNYRLLDAFRGLFEGTRYQHRRPGQGDFVSYHLYEDLHDLGTSQLLVGRIDDRERVLCVANTRQGIAARRGDGTFGELVPGVVPRQAGGFVVELYDRPLMAINFDRAASIDFAEIPFAYAWP